jgi:hypothetical protein
MDDMLCSTADAYAQRLPVTDSSSPPPQGNRHYFLTLVWLNLYAALVSAIVGFIQIQRLVYSEHVRPGTLAWLLSFEIINVFVGLGLAGLAIAQASQVARNVTTNELANWHRWAMTGGAQTCTPNRLCGLSLPVFKLPTPKHPSI